MPTAFIGTGSPTTLTMNGACTVGGPSIGLFVFVSVVPTSTAHSYTSFTTRTLTYGPSNIAATSLGAVDAPGSANGWIELFFLQGITFGAGASSKVVYTSSAAVKSIGIETITYTNVSQVTPGSFTTNSHTGTTCSLSIASVVGKYVVGGFACAAAISGASAGTQRLVANNGTSGNAQNASVVDAVGAAVSTMTATTASSAAWAAVGCGIDFIVASNADHQTTVDALGSSLIGAPSSGVSQTSMQTAVTNHFTNLLGTSTSVEALAQPAPKTGLISAAVDFSAYPNTSAVPSIFTVIPSGLGTGHYAIVNGKAVWVPDAGGVSSGESDLYNVTPTNTDYQIVSFIPTSAPASGSFFYLGGRCQGVGSSVNSGVNLQLSSSTGGNYDSCQITGNSWTSSAFSLTYIAGATYSLVLGVQGLGLRYFQVLINGVAQMINPSGVGAAQYYIQDSGAVSLVGSTRRYTGFLSSADQRFGVNRTPLPVSWFGMQDQNWQPGPPVVGTVLTLETTASTAPVQLTTKTDAVQVTIGSSGSAEVWLDDYSFASAASVISQMSFDVLAGTAPTFGAVNATGYTGTNPSGTHTPNAADNYVFVPVSYQSTLTGVTYGGVAMTPLFGPTAVSGGNGIALYGLAITPGAGAKTVAVTGTAVVATSISYNGVGAVGVPILATATGTAVTQSVVNHPSCTILQVISNASTAGSQSFSAYNQTSRYTKASGAGVNNSFLVGEMAGLFGTVTGSATAPVSAVWESLVLPLMGVGSIAAATNIANGYWVGGAQAASTTGGQKMSSVQLMSGLPPGTVTFVPKYCVVGSGTGSFQYRRTTVTPK